MTLLDTIMVLTLRKELQMGGTNRVFIGQSELFEQLAQYRRLESQDQSSYQSKLKASWNRLVEARILLKSDIEDRFEISPVLKLIFGTEEAAAVSEEFELMLKRAQQAFRTKESPMTTTVNTAGSVPYPGQWRLARVDMANWGTFNGFQSFPSTGADCLSPASGSGKSTVLDAVAAVLTPPTS